MSAVPPLHLEHVGSENHTQGSCCSTVEEGAEIVYNDKRQNFEAKTYNVTCCVFGGNRRRDHQKTQEALNTFLEKEYGQTLQEVTAALGIELSDHEGISSENFKNILDEANRVKTARTVAKACTRTLTVMHSGGEEEPVDFQKIRAALALKKSLDDKMRDEVYERVIGTLVLQEEGTVTTQMIREIVKKEVELTKKINELD